MPRSCTSSSTWRSSRSSARCSGATSGCLPCRARPLRRGAIASLMIIGAYPIAVSAGASGAVIGLYGLLLASGVWLIIRRKREADLRAELEATTSESESELDADPPPVHAIEETIVDDMRI